MRTTFLPFSPPFLGEDELDEVLDTLRSDWITTGPKTRQFQTEFANYVSAPEAMAVFSCTDALHVALAALGIGPGDAVFTTTMTFCSTVHVIEHVGARPVLVDIDPIDLCIDVAALQRAIESTISAGEYTPRAIMPVHYGGNPCDMTAIDALAAQYKLSIIEDAAHALPTMVQGRMIGDPSAPEGVVRATAFSFYATKNLATAEGGMLTGPADFLAEARLWGLHGMSRDAWNRYGEGGSWYYEVVRPGFKCNMTDIQAALGIHQLRRLDGFQRRRREVVAQYQSGLSSIAEIELPTERPGNSSAWHLYPIRLNLEMLTIGRAAFIEELAKANIGASVHFIPVHLHPYYRDRYSFEPTDFPVALAEFERLVSIPLNPRLTDSDVTDVVGAVQAICRENRR